ncbi:DUF802 domain-containing protein [Ideonella sp. YS5]|uniref:DUF802 domain-containing protein n=1 Tax=Ideonella sp. YS5 TaxID=3453714 RepID=UPI003EF00E70
MNKILYNAAFAAGLAMLGWIGYGYLGAAHALALGMTGLVAAFYLMGAVELHRFGQATASLDTALKDIPTPLAALGPWLDKLHPSLRTTVRLRVEGERIALPGPGLTPYLAGLLVLLGMLGTFLGMVATLNGTGAALDSATDVQAVRATLAAPVRGLGLAFGTSVAGVAASAMLGLMSALRRRERLRSAQALDAAIATTLRAFSPAQHREEAFKLLQQQAGLMPALVDKLQSLMDRLEQQGQSLGTQLAEQQAGFHREAQTAYTGLAASVDRTLQNSLAESTRLAAETLRPLVETTMAHITRETASLHQAVAGAAQQQLDGLAQRFEATTHSVATSLTTGWQAALAEHQQTSRTLALDTREALGSAATAFGQQAGTLVSNVDAAHGRLREELAQQEAQRLATWQQALAATAGALQEQWQGSHAEAVERQREIHDAMQQQWQAANAETLVRQREALDAMQQQWSESHADHLARQRETHEALQQHWREATADTLARQHETHDAIQQQWREASTQTLARQRETHEALQQQWQQAGSQALAQQRAIVETLEKTASAMTTQADAHARETIAEITRLMQAAGEAPRVAAEVIAEMRQKVSDSVARDTASLDERNRLMETLSTLLDAVNKASHEQRGAIDALIESTASVLDRVGTQFTDKAAAETDKLAAVAAQVTGSAVEVASLGDAFGVAVQLFSQSSDKLMEQLRRVEASLTQSISRSDEQLAYYVAQARELIDLSVMSQKQIIDDLQQLATSRRAIASEPA